MYIDRGKVRLIDENKEDITPHSTPIQFIITNIVLIFVFQTQCFIFFRGNRFWSDFDNLTFGMSKHYVSNRVGLVGP